jgi:Uma2 family endonuclease
MATAAVLQRYTPTEYLALERAAEFKCEYCNGFITAMAGARRKQNLITVNISAEIRDQLRNRRCEVYSSDMRVRTSEDGLYTYPDVVVVCDEPIFLDDELDTLLNPRLIAEVLSPSTEGFDRGDKFDRFKENEALREYVLVSQDEVLVERFPKQGEGWARTEYRDIGATLVLESIGCAIPLREIYAKVNLAGA